MIETRTNSATDTPVTSSNEKAQSLNKDGVLVGDKAKLTAEDIVAAALSSRLVEQGSEVSIKDLRLM